MNSSFLYNHAPCSLHIVTVRPCSWDEEHDTRETTDRWRVCQKEAVICPHEAKEGASPSGQQLKDNLTYLPAPPVLGTDPQNEVGRRK
jgi:hypothetical protein